MKKNFLIISFQANVFAIILAKLFNLKVIVRANTAPEKFVNSFFKKLFMIFILITIFPSRIRNTKYSPF